MRMTAFSLYVSLILTTASVYAQTLKPDKEVVKAIKAVKPEAIQSHIQYLADDRLQGRLPGTEGYQLAVDYVVKQYQAMGVQPAGENGTYLQRVKLRQSQLAADVSLIIQDSAGIPIPLTHRKDYIVYPHPQLQQLAAEAPLVFAGFGISAPGLGYDDYATLDVKDKVVVIVRGAPDKFPSTIAAHSQNWETIQETAAQRGAIGVIMATVGSNTDILPNLTSGIYSVQGPDGKVAVSRYYASEKMKLLAMIRLQPMTRLFTNIGRDLKTTLASLKAGTPASFPLKTIVRASFGSLFRDIESYNVVGQIPGTDAQLKKEYVVHSAHLDHLGIGAPVEGDSIYNGAHDNASGVASLLEIASIYARLPRKPKRSVLLVMVTAEEMGLLGSAYFAQNPTVSRQSMVANINTDMPTLIAPLLSAVALGAAHSSLQQPVEAVCRYLGIGLEPDPEPEQNRFIRSDQYSFVREGIPALHLKYGNKTADGQNNLNTLVQQWRARYYHKPQDEINGTFDFKAAKTYVQLNFLVGYQIAQQPNRPTWNPGDFFGAQFSR